MGCHIIAGCQWIATKLLVASELPEAIAGYHTVAG